MASTFKAIGANDVISSRTLLHEAIPITGTIVSGTYSEENVKNYSHGMFQSVYDYPYLSSSANHIFDITIGTSQASNLYTSVTSQQSKKKNIYNQMAQLLVGYDVTGAIMQFDEDGDLTQGNKIRDAVVISFARLLTKDEIKKASFSLELGIAPSYNAPFTTTTTITDRNADTQYKVNSPAGEYAILYATGGLNIQSEYVKCGLLYYQAGIAVLTSSLFAIPAGVGESGLISGDAGPNFIEFFNDETSITGAITSHEISGSCTGVRNRIKNLTFNNTTELNSTIYFCRANHNEFNFSANPTYLSESKIQVKSNSSDMPISYITTVGLYSADNQLLAVGKLSEPLRKSPQIEYTLRARLDY